MKKYLFIILFALPFLSSSNFSFAANILPQFIQLQAVLIDDAGHVLKDLQETDMTLSILDIDGDIYYQEVQHVIVIHGAVSVLVGSGNDPTSGVPTGGIPPDALFPDRTKLLRFQISEKSIPEADLELVSVPYAYYAQVAMGLDHAINSLDIENGGIELEDLSDQALEALRGNRTRAREVTLESHLINAAGNNLESILSSFDYALEVEKLRMSELETRNTELVNRVTNVENRVTNLEEENNQQNNDFAAQLAQERAERQAADGQLDGRVTQNYNDLSGQIIQERTERQQTDAQQTQQLNDHEQRIVQLENPPPNPVENPGTGIIAAAARVDAGLKTGNNRPANPPILTAGAINFSSVARLNNGNQTGDHIIGTVNLYDLATYQLNFTNQLPNTNYFVSCTADFTGVDEIDFNNAGGGGQYYPLDAICIVTNRNEDFIRVQTRSPADNDGSAVDYIDFHVIVVRAN